MLVINKQESINSDFLGICVQSLLIAASLLFASSEDVYKYLIIVGINIIYIILKSFGTVRTIKLSPYILWVTVFNVFLFFYGFSTIYEGYSVLYHGLTIISAICIYINMWKRLYMIENYVEAFSVMSSIFIIVYLLIFEREMLISKWYLLVQGTSWYRIGDGIGINSNTIAMYLSIFTFFEVRRIFKCPSLWEKLLLTILLAAQAGTIFFTGSKKGLFLLLMAVFLIPVVVNKKKINIKGILVGAGATLIVIYLMLNIPILYNVMGHRIADMFETFGISTTLKTTSLVGSSTDLRIGMISEALEMFWQHPIFGGGWNKFAVKSGYGMYSHNNFTELLVSMGILGFLLFYGFYVYLFDKNDFIK